MTFRSRRLAAYGLLTAHGFVVFDEVPTLRRQLGDVYEKYVEPCRGGFRGSEAMGQARLKVPDDGGPKV